MAIAKAENTKDTDAAIFFGAVLCVLLAFFAVERRVAAYPSHRVAATTIAAAGVQKPEQIAFTGTQTLRAPVLFLSILVLFAAASLRRIPYSVEYHRLRMCPGLRYHSPSMANAARSRSTLRPHRITIAHGRFAHPCFTFSPVTMLT